MLNATFFPLIFFQPALLDGRDWKIKNCILLAVNVQGGSRKGFIFQFLRCPHRPWIRNCIKRGERQGRRHWFGHTAEEACVCSHPYQGQCWQLFRPQQCTCHSRGWCALDIHIISLFLFMEAAIYHSILLLLPKAARVFSVVCH